MSTEVKAITATGLQIAVMHLIRDRLNQCRAACPGIGGDIDASNLLHMIEHKEWSVTAVRQACNTLRSLADGLNACRAGTIDAQDALEAAHAVVTHAMAVNVSRRFVTGCERGEHVGERFFSALLDDARLIAAINPQ